MKYRRVKPWLVAGGCLLMSACSLAANLNYRALLVGVSGYPGLDAKLQLEGPRNDVTRMRGVLLQRGVPAQNIAVLADGVLGAELPTRANILGQLDRLASTAKPNDYIVLHMAGHGSQQPVSPGSPFARDEPDGLFEIFLPRDVGAWQNLPGGKGGAVQNAIFDHEIRAAVDRMTATGAFVWGIFDSCHSATLVRSAGGSEEVRMRQVSPQDLGVPATAMDRATPRAPAGTVATAATAVAPSSGAGSVAANRGGSAFFYAAQTSEPTPEMRLPAGHPKRTSHGLFSFVMMQALEGGAGMSYRQLSQYVLTRYGGMNETRVTPLFSGTALDSAVMGQDAATVRQWKLTDAKELTVGAGALADLEEGAVLAILPTPISGLSEAIGYVQVSRAELATARIEPVDYAGIPKKTDTELKVGTVGRLVQQAMKFSLSVGVDLQQCTRPCAFDAPLTRLRNAKPGEGVAGAQVQWVAPGQAADVRLTAIGDRLWLMPPTLGGQQACTLRPMALKAACDDQMERSLVSITLGPLASPGNAAQTIGRALHAASRAANLMRIASALASSPTNGQVKTSVAITSKGGRRTAYVAGQVPRLEDGDKLLVTLENTGRVSVDVTALYLDSRYGITAMFPRGLGASNRLESAASDSFELEIHDDTLGLERLAVIAVEAEKQSERADFSYLAQPSLPSETVTRGGNEADGNALFRDAGFAEYATRGGRPAAVSARTGMQVFSWQVVR